MYQRTGYDESVQPSFQFFPVATRIAAKNSPAAFSSLTTMKKKRRL